MKKFKVFFFLILFSIPLFGVFAQSPNVGIIPSNIWYSKDPFEEGDKIKIYTVVYNADTRELSGSVIFFDNNIFLGKNTFKVPGKGALDVSIDWSITTGDHLIFAKIENAKFKNTNGTYEDTYLAENKSEESKRTISKKIDITETTNNLVNNAINSNTVSNIKNIVSENTPAFVTKTIDATFGTLESLREDASVYSAEQKKEVKKDIEAIETKQMEQEGESEKILNENLDNALSGETREGGSSLMLDKERLKTEESTIPIKIQKPFKYLELFGLSLLSFVSNNKIVFYAILVGITFFILRFIWRLVF